MESITIKGISFQLTDSARKTLAFTICMMCLFLFAISAYDKIVDHERFLAGLSKVKFIGSYAVYLAWGVPIAEIIVSILLIYPPSQKYGLHGFIGLMVIFTLYIGSMLLWAQKLPCHCNLIIEKLSFAEHLAFNLAFILLALWATYLKRKLLKITILNI